MDTELVDGHAMAAQLLDDVAGQVLQLPSAPGLAVVLISDDPRQHRQAALKHRAAATVGIRTVAQHLSPTSTTDAVRLALDDLAADPDIDGVFLQLPLPDHLDPQALHDRLPPAVDVDGLGRTNRLAPAGQGVHRPAAVEAVVHVLARHDIALAGRRAVVVGDSWDLGAPLRSALSRAGADVATVAGAAVDLADRCRAADVLVTTAGVPGLIHGACVKSGAVVIDAGGSITADGPAGDVDLVGVDGIAALVVPHPGGIGPLTVACLLRSTVVAARA